MRRRLLWLAIALLLAAACGTPEQRAETHIERGQEALSQGEIRAALLEFESALKLRPDDAALYEQIGDVLFEDAEANEEALAYYQEANRLEPERLHSKMRVARLIAVNDPKRARALVDEEMRRNGRSPIVLRTRAHLALLDGQLDEALFAARDAVKYDDTSAPSWAQLGVVYLAKISARRRRGEDPGPTLHGLALGAFDKVEEAKGGAYPRARLEKARVFLSVGQPKQAKAQFLDAVNLAKQQGIKAETKLAIRNTIDFARRVGDGPLLRSMFRDLTELEPGNYAVWDSLAEAYDAFPGHTGEEIYLELLGRDPKAATVHVLYAGWLIRHERADDAVAQLENARDQGVDALVLDEALVRLSLMRGDLARARAVWVEMAEEDAKARPTRFAEAQVALAENRLDDAITILEALSREEPQYETERMLALALQRRGDLHEARIAVDRAIRLAPPPKAAALRLRARIDVDSEAWRSAVSVYESLLEKLQPLTPSEQADYALALRRAGRVEESRAVLEQALARPPLRPHVALVFAELEGETQPKRSYRLLKRVHGMAPMQLDVLERLTRLDLDRGRPGAAYKRLDRLVEKRLAGPAILLLRARTLAALGELPAAEADVLRAFEADPALPGAIDLLYQLYAAQGKLAEARHSFEEADAAGVLHAGARRLLARLYREDGENARARETLERVVAEAPELWAARSDLAFLLASSGSELDRALELAREAHAEARGEPYALDVLGWVELQSGRPELALRHFDAAIRTADRGANGATPTLHYHRGMALRALGRDADAAAALRKALGQGDFPEAEEARQQLEALPVS